MRMSLLPLLVACSLGLTEGKPDAETGDTAVGLDDRPPTAVTVQGLVFGVGADDFTLVAPAAAAGFVSELFAYDVLIYVEEERSDSLHLDLSLAGADGYQNPCEPVVDLPKTDWDNPRFRSGPGDVATTIGGEPVTVRDFTLSGIFDENAFGWTEGELFATFDAREVDAALPDGLHACDLLDGMGESCVPCEDGEVACFDLQLVDVRGTLVSWPFDPDPDGAGC